MPTQYTKDEMWKLFDKLPDELKQAVFSQETADCIFNTCERNEVQDMSKVAYYVGLVLMGALLPVDFQKTLQQEVGLQESVAKSVATEINRFVFYPVKPALEQLHAMDIAQGEKKEPATAEQSIEPMTKSQEQESSPEEKEDDTYREPIE